MTRYSTYKHRKIVILFTILIILPTGLSAQDRGGYAGAFLRLGLGARTQAMGGAFVGNPIDGYSVYYNPAGLGVSNYREVDISYRDLSLDRTYHYIGFASPLPPMAGIAIGWIHAGVDNIDGRDFSGKHTCMYSDSQDGIIFGFGLKPADNLSVGIGGTFLRESLVDITASGFGFNFGLYYKPLQIISVGFAVRDINARFAWNTDKLYERGSSVTDKFPTVYTGGIGLHLEQYKTVFLVDIVKNSKSEQSYKIGIENSMLEQIDLRAGLNNGSVTAGAGIHFPFMKSTGRLDYALTTSDIEPEAVHILSLCIMF